ncbi:Uncharacterised protein [Enterobacter asburiae]|uniref:Uncharacterized protein n=1 Tax=Enterobacter asburiae TaxID=61645 RepID=A0A376F8H3_ENTAS|nr:Uncharacterised protein [Enterobacter asburiae]
MKLSLVSALLIFLVPAAWADNNGVYKKAKRHRLPTRLIADIAEPTTRVL